MSQLPNAFGSGLATPTIEGDLNLTQSQIAPQKALTGGAKKRRTSPKKRKAASPKKRKATSPKKRKASPKRRSSPKRK